MVKFTENPASAKSLAFRKPIYGVGINDADYLTQGEHLGKKVHCPYYRTWTSMLNRCYSEKLHSRRPTYKGCYVCQDWLVFSTFKGWMINQDWQGKQLDKDLLVRGNKEYSPETCIFVDGYINGLLSGVTIKNGKYKLGVSMDKNRYVAQCNTKNGLKYIGRFDAEDDAHEAYKAFKYKMIHDIAIKQIEPLRSALLNYDIDYKEG